MIIACIISFIVGAMLMMCAIGMVAIQKDKEPRSKVRFFVGKSSFGDLALILLDKVDGTIIALSDSFAKRYGLNPEDFADIKPMERKEVFLNLGD